MRCSCMTIRRGREYEDEPNRRRKKMSPTARTNNNSRKWRKIVRSSKSNSKCIKPQYYDETEANANSSFCIHKPRRREKKNGCEVTKQPGTTKNDGINPRSKIFVGVCMVSENIHIKVEAEEVTQMSHLFVFVASILQRQTRKTKHRIRNSHVKLVGNMVRNDHPREHTSHKIFESVYICIK